VSVDSVLSVVYFVVALGVGVTVHEYAHAAAALRLGDHSPKLAGRMTLNPRPHVDTFGTLVLPGILLLPILFGRAIFIPFGYGKPQPLNVWNLRNRERDPILVALAGPAANVALAFAFGAMFRLAQGEAAVFLVRCLQVSVVLAVLNLIPLPGLDGSRVLARFLPERAREVYTSLDQYLALFLLLVFFLLPTPILAFVQAIGNGICQVVAGGPCL
jgi:Zn-dependent protease